MRSVLPILMALFVLTACGYVAPPPVSVGSCVLAVLQDGPTPERLQPPYRVRQHKFIPRRSGANDAEADVTFRGTGWTRVNMTLTDPTGTARMDNEEIPGDEINQGTMGTSLDSPGMWRFRLADTDAGCTQEFSVEVLAPTG